MDSKTPTTRRADLWCNCQATTPNGGPWHPLGDTSFCPPPKVGEIVTGREANRLPVGTQIRFHEQNADDPVWTKTEDTTYDPEWTARGQIGWPINEAASWVVVSIPGRAERQT